jgi:hypothetical protein
MAWSAKARAASAAKRARKLIKVAHGTVIIFPKGSHFGDPTRRSFARNTKFFKKTMKISTAKAYGLALSTATKRLRSASAETVDWHEQQRTKVRFR